MNSSEINRNKINEYAAKSARIYLEYLNENERYKGVVRVDVRSFKRALRDDTYILQLSKKIREDSIEYVLFEINHVIYQTNDVQIINYDEKTKLLTVKIVGQELLKRFQKKEVIQIVLISDLKFLVKRVENWYICNEKNFSIPTEPHDIVPDEALYLPNLMPSDEQKRAINQILYGNPWAKPNECYDKKAFTYIWGPPGTGKTQVVLAYSVLNYLTYLKDHPEQKILLTASTNVALDQMLFSLIHVLVESGISLSDTICRIGVPTNKFKEQYPYLCRHDEEFENHLLKELNQTKVQIDRLQQQLQNDVQTLSQQTNIPADKNPLFDEINKKRASIQKLREKENELIKKKENDRELTKETHGIPIIACTLDGYIAHNLEQAFSYAHIFLDEAGYASLIKAGVLFVNSCPVTFLGDHMQLNPICEMNGEKITKDSDNETVVLWDQSALYMPDFLTCNQNKIIEKYVNHTEYNDMIITNYNELETIFLSKTFRFGSPLSKILNQYIYQNEETPFHSANDAIETNLYYIHAPLTAERKNKRDNIAEANAIKRFLNTYPAESDVGILTAYKDQIYCLQKELCDSDVIWQQPDKIFTVHATQGHEWDTVILSVSDDGSAEKFFTDTLRQDSGGAHVINTAVSRTKRNLIIVCNYNYWIRQENQLLTDLLKISKKIIAGQPETYPIINKLQDTLINNAPTSASFVDDSTATEKTLIKKNADPKKEKIKSAIKGILWTAFIAIMLYATFIGGPKDRKKNEIPKPSTNVYITSNGQKYHMDNCETIIEYQTKMVTQKQAQTMGRTPCKVCKPDKIIEEEWEIYHEFNQNQEDPPPKFPYY